LLAKLAREDAQTTVQNSRRRKSAGARPPSTHPFNYLHVIERVGFRPPVMAPRAACIAGPIRPLHHGKRPTGRTVLEAGLYAHPRALSNALLRFD
jgi:hypothetical protein